MAAWRARAARMYPSDFTDCGDPVRYTLLAALCWTRHAELVDGLAELLTGLIHRINARAERRVEKELIGELANVPGKRGIFTRMVDAALEHPDGMVREALYPVVPGGVKTLSALTRELKATERAVAERVRYQLRGSYSHYYRRMLAPLLAALEFRRNTSACLPVMDAIGLLARYAGAGSDQKLYAAGDRVPVDGVVPKAWLDGSSGLQMESRQPGNRLLPPQVRLDENRPAPDGRRAGISRRPRPHRVLGTAATPRQAPGGPGHLAPAAPPARPVPDLPGSATARRPPATRPGGMAAVAYRHAQSDPQARDRQRDRPRHAGRTRRALPHTRPLPTPYQRRQPSTSARSRAIRACLSRLPGKRARPVLRGPRRGNAPGLPDELEVSM